MRNDRYILAMWCCDGFECLQDITEFHPDTWDVRNTMNLLRDGTREPNPLSHQVSTMLLRARINSQRNYEIYMFTASPDIDIKDINDWADKDPQSLVDWIRKNHCKQIFGGPAPVKAKKIV